MIQCDYSFRTLNFSLSTPLFLILPGEKENKQLNIFKPFICLIGLLLFTPVNALAIPNSSSDTSSESLSLPSTDRQVSTGQLQGNALIDTLLQQGIEEKAQGQISRALVTLTNAVQEAEKGNDANRKALALAAISDVYLLNRQLEESLKQAQEALAVAKLNSKPMVLAAALNHLGNSKFAKQQFAAAAKDFDEAAQKVLSIAPLFHVKLTINTLRALLAANKTELIKPMFKKALEAAHALPDTEQKAIQLLALGNLPVQAKQASFFDNNILAAVNALKAAEAIANQLDATQLKSYAKGYMAELYAQHQHSEDTLQLFQQALFFAHQADASELLLRWYWLRGRLFKSINKLEQAETDYRLALDYLQQIQPVLLFGRRGDPFYFRNTIGGIYRELVEILLAKSDVGMGNSNVYDAMNVMEGYKSVELKSYFMDDCVTEWQENIEKVDLNQLGSTDSAFIYPIVFPERTVLLFAIGQGGWQYVDIPVSSNHLKQSVTGFREQLKPSGNSRTLKKYAYQLYQWLINPLEAQLKQQQINALVIVPDGFLRTIPFSALFDGQDFLIRRFAFGLSPSLKLTHINTPLEGGAKSLFLGGLSKSVEGFPPLQYVLQEIENIASLQANTQFLDESFKKDEIKTEMQNKTFSIVHFATHTRIENDPRNSFLLTYDDKIALPELRQYVQGSSFRKKPIDLLVLSACDTAEGDERAALGLAGVAIKAGASSVVASLWSVSDESTAQLMPDFFENVISKLQPKAKALQAAQLKLLDSELYYHPFYWSTFILIGNWR